MMKGRYEDIAERHLEIKLRGTTEFMCGCPFCNGSTSLQFNIDNGLWVCFRCDAKGNAKSLVKKRGGVYTDPAISVDHVFQTIDRIRAAAKIKDKVKVHDEDYLRRFDFEDSYWSEERGYSSKTIRAFQLGYDPILDRNTIPYRNVEGELLGIIYRLKGKDIFPRYIYPEGFNRRESLFASWKIAKSKTTVVGLVEGSTDVMALWQAGIPALGQYGSSISKQQVRLLHRLGIREAVMFYDYDEAGLKAIHKSQEMIEGILLSQVYWNSRHYCWHKKLCGCGNHDWRTIGKCQEKLPCTCGRIHEMDPGSLKSKEIQYMWDNRELVGRRSEWRGPRRAR
jgi:hypothetical protein